jgi:hypothetical protein
MASGASEGSEPPPALHQDEEALLPPGDGEGWNDEEEGPLAHKDDEAALMGGPKSPDPPPAARTHRCKQCLRAG